MAELDGIKRLQEESLEFSNNLDFIADKWKELSENERRDVLRNIRKHTRMENVLNVVQNTDFSSLSFFILTIIVVVFFGYKLYKSLVEKERRKDEKRRQKQQKKKK